MAREPASLSAPSEAACAWVECSAFPSRIASASRAATSSIERIESSLPGIGRSITSGSQSVSIKAPQTSLFQMRIQFMAEEGVVIRKGETVLEFDNSSLTDQVRSL